MEPFELKGEFIISGLIANMVRDNLSDAQLLELLCWRMEDPLNEQLFNDLLESYQRGLGRPGFDTEFLQKHLNRVEAKIGFAENIKAKGTNWYNMNWYSIALAAAAVTVSTLIGLTFIFKPYYKAKPLENSSLLNKDKLPDLNTAILSFENGEVVSINDNIDTTFNSGMVSITLNKGTLKYKEIKQGSMVTNYATLLTPKRGGCHIQLEDNTDVWLNSGSSIRFPTRFSGHNRKVEVSGEVYFNVFRNTESPFIVQVGNNEIKVLGTEFNVKAYSEDNSIITTLINGAIIVNNKKDAVSLQPGKSLKISNNTFSVFDADIDSATSWRNGEFLFRNTDLGEVLKTLSKWYGFDIVYMKGTNAKANYFSGQIKRDLPLSEILSMMELAELARFSMQNDTLTVRSY